MPWPITPLLKLVGPKIAGAVIKRVFTSNNEPPIYGEVRIPARGTYEVHTEVQVDWSIKYRFKTDLTINFQIIAPNGNALVVSQT